MWIDWTIALYCAATASASGNALFATAEKSVGNRIERIMTVSSERLSSYSLKTLLTAYASRRNLTQPKPRGLLFCADAHSVERARDEDRRYQKEETGEDVSNHRTILAEISRFAADAHRQLDRQQSKQRGELDHRIHRDGRSIFERIADCIANDSCVVQRCAFLFHVDFDYFLRVVPGAAGVRHKDRLVKPEDRDRNQVTNKKERLEK